MLPPPTNMAPPLPSLVGIQYNDDGVNVVEDSVATAMEHNKNEGGGEEVGGKEEEEEEEDPKEDPKEEPVEELERRLFYFDPNNTWEEEVMPEGKDNPNGENHQEDVSQHHANQEAMEVDGLPTTNKEPIDEGLL